MVCQFQASRQLVELEARFLHLLLKGRFQENSFYTKVVVEMLGFENSEYGKLQRHLYIEHVGKILDVPIDYLVKRWNKVAKVALCASMVPSLELNLCEGVRHNKPADSP